LLKPMVKIWAQNNSNGKGATFSFSQPYTTIYSPTPCTCQLCMKSSVC
jgi:hypothetical protein